MPILTDLKLLLDIQAVLRSQGSNPDAVIAHRPALVEVAERAIQKGQPMLQPKVYYRELPLLAVQHTSLILGGDEHLSGQALAQHLAKASAVIVVLCTIGSVLEQYVREVLRSDPVNALALDGVGSAAVEALANAACHYFEAWAAKRGWQVCTPLSPGMIGWPVEQGQPQIFKLFSQDQLDVELTPSCVMIPAKSLTFVLGCGPEMETTGCICDSCHLNERCRYRPHSTVAQV